MLAPARYTVYTTWSPTEHGVVFTSMGLIFETLKATVRITCVEFNPAAHGRRPHGGEWRWRHDEATDLAGGYQRRVPGGVTVRAVVGV